MQSIGKKGEDLAVEFLVENGYEILARNYRFKKSEIDIVCVQANLLIFVEVKTRSSLKYGPPETFVSMNQQKAILKAAEEYLVETGWNKGIRFDVVSVFMNDVNTEIEHLKDAFY